MLKPLLIVPEGHTWVVVRDGQPMWSGTNESAARSHGARLSAHNQVTEIASLLELKGGFRWQCVARYHNNYVLARAAAA